MSNFALAIRQSVKHREILLASIGAAIWLLQTPLQHYMELSRFQHYAISVFAIASGFLLQAAVSWRHFSLAGRLAMVSSWLYLTAFGLVCYHNPWLDTNFDLQTATQERMRPLYAGGFLISGFIVSFFWATWLNETTRGRARLPKVATINASAPDPHAEPEGKVS